MIKSISSKTITPTLKASFMAAAVMFSSLGAYAADTQDDAPDELCVDIAAMAGKVMQARQEGATKAQLNKVAQKADETSQALAAGIIDKAFTVKRYENKADQEAQIDKFISQYYNTCFNALNKG